MQRTFRIDTPGRISHSLWRHGLKEAHSALVDLHPGARRVHPHHVRAARRGHGSSHRRPDLAHHRAQRDDGGRRAPQWSVRRSRNAGQLTGWVNELVPAWRLPSSPKPHDPLLTITTHQAGSDTIQRSRGPGDGRSLEVVVPRVRAPITCRRCSSGPRPSGSRSLVAGRRRPPSRAPCTRCRCPRGCRNSSRSYLRPGPGRWGSTAGSRPA